MCDILFLLSWVPVGLTQCGFDASQEEYALTTPWSFPYRFRLGPPCTELCIFSKKHSVRESIRCSHKTTLHVLPFWLSFLTLLHTLNLLPGAKALSRRFPITHVKRCSDERSDLWLLETILTLRWGVWEMVLKWGFFQQSNSCFSDSSWGTH